MGTKDDDKVAIVVEYHKDGIKAICTRCNKLLLAGYYTVGIKLASYRYLVGQDPQLSCCGETAEFPLVFGDLEEANKISNKLKEKIHKEGNLEDIYLLEVEVVDEPTHVLH